MTDVKDTALDAQRFPVGTFVADPHADLSAKINDIAAAPAEVSALVAHMTPAQLDTPYRPGGWTVAQVVNHLADSHVNAYIRTRFALVEDNFTVKPYDEARWADLVDAKSRANVAASLSILTGLHARWADLLRSLTPAEFERPMLHPERGPMTIGNLVQLYSWHSRHHAGHVRLVK